MSLLINIDVPNLDWATTFYTEAFALPIGRRFSGDVVELVGWPAPLYLLLREANSIGAGSTPRTYARHWTPIHLDVVVDDVEKALARAVAAGAHPEGDVRTEVWGRLVTVSDPFGHGFCLLQFLNRGYDELVSEQSASVP